MAVQHVLDPRLVSVELLLYRSSYADHGAVVDVLLLQDVVAPELARLQRPRQFRSVNPVRLHHLLILRSRNIGSMDYHAVDTDLRKGIVGGEPAKPRLVDSMIFAIRVILLQKVKELFRGRLLGMTLYYSHLGGYRHLPTFRMDVDSYENLLSFEGNFVTLHLGTVLIVYISRLLRSYKDTIQLLSYQLFMTKTVLRQFS